MHVTVYRKLSVLNVYDSSLTTLSSDLECFYISKTWCKRRIHCCERDMYIEVLKCITVIRLACWPQQTDVYMLQSL